MENWKSIIIVLVITMGVIIGLLIEVEKALREYEINDREI